MRLRLTAVTAMAFVFSMFLVSVQARAASNDQGKTSTYIGREVTVGSTKLSPGQYDVKADGSNVTFAWQSSGKVVAQAPIQWKDESSKAASSNVEYNGDKVVAVHFKGKTRFASISD